MAVSHDTVAEMRRKDRCLGLANSGGDWEGAHDGAHLPRTVGEPSAPLPGLPDSTWPDQGLSIVTLKVRDIGRHIAAEPQERSPLGFQMSDLSLYEPTALKQQILAMTGPSPKATRHYLARGTGGNPVPRVAYR